MAAGVPVLASGVGGIPEIISGGAGLVAEPGSANSFARHILRLRDEPDLERQLLENATIRVQAFDLERKIDEVFACYHLDAQDLARSHRQA
jgi:glycosyltransferase involved in cell wall biosynthesis